MFPGVDGFHWSPAHVIFLALFFAVALTIAVTVAGAAIRSVSDFRNRRANAMCWKMEFDELPEAERRCRHELAGRVEQRECPNAFDCRHCAEYERIAQLPAAPVANTLGLLYPDDRLYHRGHTWVKAESDGTYAIGLDDLSEHLIGKPDAAELPEPGAEIECNATAWRLKKSGTEIRVRAPLDGTVVAKGGPGEGWYLKIRPREPVNVRHLLRGPEVAAWLTREIERLQIQLTPSGVAPSLADGGLLMSGLMEAMPEADWDAALSGTFLES